MSDTMKQVYLYDGSFEGFLCCIFESYSRKEIPAAVCAPDRGQISFYDSCEIVTDPARAQRVARGLERLGPMSACAESPRSQ